MTGPECDRALQELEEYLHHELDHGDAAALAQHMEECIDCADEYELGLVLTRVIRRSCTEEAPGELREQVLVHLRTLTRR